jgi:hypothetical protein
MFKGFLWQRSVVLSDGETPSHYLKDELEAKVYDGKGEEKFSPFIGEDGIPYAWNLYLIQDYGAYAVRVYNFTPEQIRDFAAFCPCPVCRFERRPKSCTLDWLYGYVMIMFVDRHSYNCLKGGNTPFSNMLRAALEESKKER